MPEGADEGAVGEPEGALVGGLLVGTDEGAELGRFALGLGYS